MSTSTLASIARAAADLLDDLATFGLRPVAVYLGGYGSDIQFQAASAADRRAIADALGLGCIGQPYGGSRAQVANHDVLATDAGELRVEVFGLILDDEAVAS